MGELLCVQSTIWNIVITQYLLARHEPVSTQRCGHNYCKVLFLVIQIQSGVVQNMQPKLQLAVIYEKHGSSNIRGQVQGWADQDVGDSIRPVRFGAEMLRGSGYQLEGG